MTRIPKIPAPVIDGYFVATIGSLRFGWTYEGQPRLVVVSEGLPQAAIRQMIYNLFGRTDAQEIVLHVPENGHKAQTTAAVAFTFTGDVNAHLRDAINGLVYLIDTKPKMRQMTLLEIPADELTPDA